MDTGPIDSHLVLGINAPEDRVTYRRKVTCAPANNTSFGRLEYSTGEDGGLLGSRYQRSYYGPITSWPDSTNPASEAAIFSNHTYQYSKD